MAGKNRGQEKIDEEKVSMEALANFLETKKGCERVLIEEEPDDPPDFWMTVDGDQFAVEVTSIVNDYTYESHCTRLREAMERECREAGCPHGAYTLVVKGRPRIPGARTKQERETICNAVQEVMKLGERSIAAPIFEDDGGRISIRKTLDGASKFHLLPMTECWWAGEYNPDLLERFQTAIDKKIGRLVKKGVPDKCDQVVLVLYDAFLFSDIEDAKEVFQKAERFNWFHSVFWAASFTDRPNTRYPDEHGRGGCFLHSKNPKWL